ncbi:MAG TPA: triple tyrosine motif-containing protein [Chitinophagaceae bacterium]|nr:triple tyrosine motif-containing protein [Chitinophagaceae bacterium]
MKLFNRSTRTYRSYDFEEKNGVGVPANATQQLFEDKDGNIWAGTWNSGLLKYDEAKDHFIIYRILSEDQGVQSVHGINSIILANHYYFLITSESGLFLTDPAKAMNGTIPIEKLLQETEQSGATSPKTKWQILKDRQGNYWISGFSGLLKIDPGSLAFQWKPLPGENHKADIIFHVLPDNKEPLKIFLTTREGWWKYDLTTQLFSKHILPKGFENLLGNINRFITTENGYWFTSQLGVGFYSPTTNTVKDISSLLHEKMDSKVRTGLICTDGLGRIWFSVYRSGIRIYNPETGKLVSLLADSTKPDNLYGKSIFDMKQAADKSIILTSGNKIYQIDPVNFSFTVTVMAAEKTTTSIERTGPRKILFDKNNRTLMLSQQCIYSFQHGKLIQLYPRSGLADFIMENFLQDGNGNFWVTTNLGLFKTDTAFKEWVNMSDKIPAGNYDNIVDIFRTGNDEFILAASGKIGTFSLHELSKNNVPPVVIINRLKTGNTEQYLVSLKQQSWNISFKDAIEIEISAINFSNEKGNRIYYQLEGRDNDWKELTGNPVIRYDQLPPGNYRFKAKAMNGDAIWSRETILSFKVLPPFWRTWWFIGIVIIALAISLYTIYRYRLAKALELEKMRTRISTDLHDDIGATLSSISIYSETIKQQTAVQLPQLTAMLDKMGETSREMVGNMSDIVWAINPENDSFEKMLGRMQNLAAELCRVKNIQLHFTADEKLNQLQLSMEQRRNIYLIFKEALNNALKYAACKNLRIELIKENHLLILSVKDDGKGFNEMIVAENRRGGNGLKNMRHRAAEINGELKIDTEENKGTHILLKTSIT